MLLLLAIVCVASVAGHTASNSSPKCDVSDTAQRFDCFPGAGASQQACEARGCCWRPHIHAAAATEERLGNFPIGIPYCYYPADYQGYQFTDVEATSYGLRASLKRTRPSGHPGDVSNLVVDVFYRTESTLRIKIYDADKQRYEVPIPKIPEINTHAGTTDYKFVISYEKPGFKVIRRSNGKTIFDVGFNNGFVYADQFIQLSALVPSTVLYGLGEHRGPLLRSFDWRRFTMFSRDTLPIDNANLYGAHPFYLMLEDAENSHGALLLNSNALEVLLQPTPALTYRAVGGVVDLYLFLGPTPDSVIQQYTQVVGRPFLPPYWSLGFHLCRWGYFSTAGTRKVFQRNRDAGIPLETMWNDIDYMDKNNDFTFNQEKFSDLPKFVDELHKANLHYVAILDPGVSGAEPAGAYPPYDLGITMDVFVKNALDDKPFVGKVWNSISTVFPDFTNPKTTDYWTQMVRNLHNRLPVDGLWIDMNEPSNFYDGHKDGCAQNNLNFPPYTPHVLGGRLFAKTVCMDARQHAGRHYDVHNLHGISETIATDSALRTIREGRRPFIISRSTFPGSGHFGGHWTGDVRSTWDDMAHTIPAVLNFNMYGIPMVGADICGFNGDTTAALCQRWMELGAFYPFSRNHNTWDKREQDPVALGAQVVSAARKALLVRYTLLPYLYSLMFRSHLYGNPVLRPLSFQFAGDAATHALDAQFMWGEGLMFTPVLKKDVTKQYSYFPAAKWYDYYSGSGWLQSEGAQKLVDAPLDTIPIWVLGGIVIPTQTPNVASVAASRNESMSLLVALDQAGQASGELYWDDGDSVDTVESEKYRHVRFAVDGNGRLSSTVSPSTFIRLPSLDSIRVLGVEQKVTFVLMDGVVKEDFVWDSKNGVLEIRNLRASLLSPLDIKWFAA